MYFIRKNLLFLLSFFISISLLKSKEPIDYAVYGLIPGLGQFLLGNSISGAVQLGAFLMFMGNGLQMRNRPDYIPFEERTIKFQLQDVLIADYLEKNGFLYKDFPFLSESKYDRIQRMIQYKKIIEINPLLEYGTYERKTYATTLEEMLFQSSQHVIFYSVYSSYRDAGGIRFKNLKQENYFELAISPFQPEYIFNPYFLIPIGLLSISIAYETKNPPKNPEYTLLYPGMKSSGYMNFYASVLSFNAGVSEEAFFRGFLNHYLIRKMGIELGIISSSMIFGLGHLGNGAGNAIFATFAGLYFGYIHYKNNWDIRQGIAIHFWWDFIIFLYNIRFTREDKNVLKNQKEIYYMPIYFEFKF